jgi:hypothetical protein
MSDNANVTIEDFKIKLKIYIRLYYLIKHKFDSKNRQQNFEKNYSSALLNWYEEREKQSREHSNATDKYMIEFINKIACHNSAGIDEICDELRDNYLAPKLNDMNDINEIKTFTRNFIDKLTSFSDKHENILLNNKMYSIIKKILKTHKNIKPVDIENLLNEFINKKEEKAATKLQAIFRDKHGRQKVVNNKEAAGCQAVAAIAQAGVEMELVINKLKLLLEATNVNYVEIVDTFNDLTRLLLLFKYDKLKHEDSIYDIVDNFIEIQNLMLLHRPYNIDENNLGTLKGYIQDVKNKKFNIPNLHHAELFILLNTLNNINLRKSEDPNYIIKNFQPTIDKLISGPAVNIPNYTWWLNTLIEKFKVPENIPEVIYKFIKKNKQTKLI